MGDHTPSVIAVVLNWCGEEMTRACLTSLEGSTYQSLETLIVDNGSPDGSGDRLRDSFPHLSYLQTGANLGYAGGNNRGIRWALDRGADFVLVLNNDTVLEPDTISFLVSAAASAPGKVGAVVPKVLFFHDPERIWFGGGGFDSLKGLGVHWREGDRDGPENSTGTVELTFMNGACCLLSAEALRELHGFDESYFAYVEDAELSLRMVRAGYPILYQPQARILHHSPEPGTPPTPFQIRQRDRNRLRVMRTHFSLLRRTPFLIRFYLTRAVLLLKYGLSGDWERFRAVLQGLGWA